MYHTQSINLSVAKADRLNNKAMVMYSRVGANDLGVRVKQLVQISALELESDNLNIKNRKCELCENI